TRVTEAGRVEDRDAPDRPRGAVADRSADAAPRRTWRLRDPRREQFEHHAESDADGEIASTSNFQLPTSKLINLGVGSWSLEVDGRLRRPHGRDAIGDGREERKNREPVPL